MDCGKKTRYLIRRELNGSPLKQLQVPAAISAAAPAQRVLFSFFVPCLREQTRPAAPSLALEEAEEDGAHQVGCWFGWAIRKDLVVPSIVIFLPILSVQGSG